MPGNNGRINLFDGIKTSGMHFSCDESRFRLSRSDGRHYVYWRCNERFGDACIRKVDRYGSGNIMVWGATLYYTRVRLVGVEAISLRSAISIKFLHQQLFRL